MIKLDFIKETTEEPKYWLVGLYSFDLADDCVIGSNLLVLTIIIEIQYIF